MNGRYFLDTNVIVYTFDDGAPKKREAARNHVRSALENRRGVISWQVVQEFLNVALHRFSSPMSTRAAGEYLDCVLSPLCEIWPTPRLYREAVMIQAETGYRFLDSLIVASAVAAGAETLYSEDLQEGRLIRGVRIRDPFRRITA